jgi:NAD(P)-dependent dehydrogenase (short-subunit alcohol dehydrogenase family)
MLAAVRPRGSGRPSVEAPLHEAMSYTYVYHMHPAAVNGMTCAVNGETACGKLFPQALWVEYTNPGYTLAATVAARLRDAARQQGREPQVVMLQNHGVFVGANSLAEIETVYADIMSTLEKAYRDAGVAADLPAGTCDDATMMQQAPRLRALLRTETQRAVITCAPYVPLADGPLSPDHIVYARSFPYLSDIGPDGVAAFRTRRGSLPKVVASQGKALFCAGATVKEARETLVAARDAALVRQLTGAFGGPRYLTETQYTFIENWEVESYRKSVAAARGGGANRLQNRVCMVTGGAQGFGLGIAEELVAAGGIVFLADINLAGARTAAADLNARYGDTRALALAGNIADEDSVIAMVRDAVRECGGLDVFVANAGVLKAGSVKTMTRKEWDFVTSVNYTGYFLCCKHVSPVISAQTAIDKQWSDIVQINSKSGLEGSNKNGAYAGSKFGTLGLTQSFAKELVEDRIKVNSICPGNYFDGPLWSDPEKGLFVQYLNTGKVPGAKTIADVRKFYEEKVPMGRGCRPKDVACAILYLVEQEYETGQAVPVTGGQVMLK